MGVLGDGQGIQCQLCHGQCSVKDGDEDVECFECHGTGVTQPEVQQEIDGFEDYLEVATMIVISSERPMFPNEWLSQPAIYCEAYNFLIPHIASFEKRKQHAGSE